MADYDKELYSSEENQEKRKLSYGETKPKYDKLQKGLNKYSAAPDWMNRIRDLFGKTTPKPKEEEQE